MSFLFALAVAGTFASSLYFVLVCLATRRYTRLQSRLAADVPPISVLKPLHGLETGLEENLATFFEQDYPHFELLFCARNFADPAFEVVRALMAKYPAVPVTLVASGEPAWPNARSFSVSRMIPEAAHDLLVVTDSDVRVAPGFLREVHGPVSSGKAALVTCLYRGLPLGGFWSRLEALGMSVELMSGVLVADMLEGMKFALGPATVTCKDVLERIGGMQVVGEYFADDFELGSLVARAGETVRLSTEVVEHAVPPYSFAESFRHQLLWMRSSRFSRPLGHLGTGLTFAVPYGLLGSFLSIYSGRWTLGLLWLLLSVANRVAQSVVVGWGVVHDRFALLRCWANPLRDVLGLVVWVCSFFGTTVHFRGHKYRLTDDGRLLLVPPPAPQ